MPNKPMQLTFPCFDHHELDELKLCLESGWVTQGPYTTRFEELIAQRHNVSHALATTSCTAGLHLAVLALDIKPGDEVIVPAFTWITSANCAEYVGARAIFVDVDKRTFNIDPVALEAAITERTRAIVVVHLFGLAAEMDTIVEIADRHKLAIIEDAACAIGTSYHQRPIGGFGKIGVFSFHPRKIITTGEGGMITTDDDELAERIGWFRNHGSTGLPASERDDPRPYTMATFDVLGFNLRMSDIQAAVGVAQMAKLDSLLADRRARARRYDASLGDMEAIAIPTSGDIEGHSYQSYVVRVVGGGRKRRDEIMDRLDALGISTRPGTHAVHCLGYYARKYGHKTNDFPNAAECAETTITLPIFPGMTDFDQDRVISALKNAL